MALDFSEYFKHVSGLGIFIFQINQLEPKQIEDNGEFCVGDCYLILYSYKTNDDINHVIYTWIGSFAQLDKRFCCAMYAVGLKDILKGNTQIIKVGPDEESIGFRDLFPDLKYSEATYSTESGLFPVQDKIWNLMLFKVHDWALENVEPLYTMLSNSHVFILDNGLEIFLWSGKDATKQQKLKGKIICQRINRNERKGRARIIEQDSGEEVSRFWDLLGFDSSDLSDSSDFVAENIVKEEWDGPVLYKVPEDLKGDVLDDAIDAKKLKRGLLHSKECFILDSGSILILWVGKNSTQEKRMIATEYLTKIVPLRSRPRWLYLDRFMQDHELELFKLYFADWEDVQFWDEKVQINKLDGIHMDIESFFTTVPLIKRDNSFLLGTLSSFNSLLVKMSVFVHSNGNFIAVPTDEVGVLYLKEAYVFLCVYKVIDDPQGLEGIPEIKEPSLECVLYFWKGRKAPRRAFATFRFKTQPELEELVKSLYNCEMKVVNVEYGKEPLILLSHLSNVVVYEKGFRNDRTHDGNNLYYRIRIDSKYGTIRACSFDHSIPFLVETDSYLTINKENATLCKGRKMSNPEFLNVHKLCESILHRKNLKELQLNIIEQNTADFPNSPIDEPHLLPILNPQFFRCSCSLGYYSIEYLNVFSQDDLRPDCIVILDSKPGPQFMWKGCEASDVVFQLTLKAIDMKKSRNDVYEDRKLIAVEQGAEPVEFTVYFNVWEDELDTEPSNSYLNQMKGLSM